MDALGEDMLPEVYEELTMMIKLRGGLWEKGRREKEG